VLAVTGQDFVVLLLGQKWAPAGPLLCIFAVRGIAHSVERTMGWIHVAAGRADRWMWWGACSAVFQLLALAVGLPFGVTGVAIAYTVAMFALFIPALVFAGRPVGIDTKDVLQAIGPQTIAGLTAVAVGFVVQLEFLGELSRFVRVFTSGTVCAVAYFAVVIGIFGVTDPLRLVFSMLRDFRAARSPVGS
jgi:PST family polysaccharide transporter